MRSKPTIRLRGYRTLTTLAFFWCFSLSAWAQISLVHVTSCGPQTYPSATCTIPATGTGNVLVVGWAGGGAATIAGIADNAGNLYTEAGNARASDTGTNVMTDIWYAKNSQPGATALTITPSPSGTSGAAVIWEFSGVDPGSPLDQTAVVNNPSASATPVGASVVTTSPAEVIVSLANVLGTVTGITSGNSFSNDSTVNGDGWAHLITASAGTFTPQWNASTSGTYSSSTASFRIASSGGGACDLNKDGQVNVVDVQLAVNMDLGVLSCPSSVNGGVCSSALVQQILNAALGEGCSAIVSHSASLAWTASVSPNIGGYNIYRSATSGGPYNKLNSSLLSTTSYNDTSVAAGQTYYYVATAVDASNNESTYSTQAQATIPTP
jgi:hypothetical protein